ncbi:transcription repressor OFP13 [Impatiens glandulifera]|uniref:transcription repressor OFP13 n=1 Tax=Impatiens glandulifera TaxID=253017 RepID=UPI001FB09D0A|nr:transcription repressor OFP13 [Impatiens glandulifera]
MKLPFIFKNNKVGRSNHHQPWQWPLCRHTNTLSFRAGQEIFKTVNSVFYDENEPRFAIPESWFTSSSELSLLSHTTDDDNSDELPLDPSTIRGLIKSERLFFEPGNTRSLMKEPKTNESINGVALAMESADPYGDFRRSMEEMVESHGLSDWEFLGELLCWYLKMNGKINHGFIIGAFVDLLIGIAVIPKSSSDSSTSYVSAASSFNDET